MTESALSSLNQMEDRFSQAAEAHALDGELTFKPMFGGVCAYVSGRVFASLSDIGLALKLPPAAQADLLALDGAKRLQYEPDAPPSKQYVLSLPAPKSRASKAKHKGGAAG